MKAFKTLILFCLTLIACLSANVLANGLTSGAANVAGNELQNPNKLCGTTLLIEHHHNPSTDKIFARTIAPSCNADDYYDSVFTKKTEHFQIFYTLSGPHKTTPEFVESVAKNVEAAWKFHTVNMGMRAPLGIATTQHFQKPVSDKLYPVEILDIDLLRDIRNILGGACHGCYGLTIPDEQAPTTSELVIDNDFKYTPSWGASIDTIEKNGKKCSYPIADRELRNTTHDYSYATQWEKGIQVTAFHELYHAVQVRYLDIYAHETFWFEASASGIEEIAAPEIDDYQSYLPAMSKSVGNSLDSMIQSYGAGILFIYLHNFVNKKTDKFIWEGFAKNPNTDFRIQLKNFAQSKGISADSLFQDFATRLAFSGSRNAFTDSANLICSDEKYWPNFSHTQMKIDNENQTFKPNVKSLAYKFYSGGSPELEDFVGKGSVILYKGNSANIQNFYTSNEAKDIFSAAQANSQVDSIVWVFSNFNGEQTLPTVFAETNLRAYPTPWRKGNLCFAPLQKNQDFIEIRNRRGNLVSREKYEGSTYCIEESRVKELMTPGVYRFRVGSSGKTKDFIVIY